MSLTSEMQLGDDPAADGLSDEVCAHCGSPLREDQEWCLECGAARTLIHRPPDWRIAAIVIASVVVLALVAFAIALVNLSSSADRVASTPSGAPTSTASARTTAAAATAATPTPTPARTASASTSTSTSTTIASWPVGLSGWTVALASSPSQSAADAAALRFAATGLNVGVLDSSQHPTMTPGEWVVFSGRYPGRAQAEAAATTVQAKVSGTPVARRVAPPGGL